MIQFIQVCDNNGDDLCNLYDLHENYQSLNLTDLLTDYVNGLPDEIRKKARYADFTYRVVFHEYESKE